MSGATAILIYSGQAHAAGTLAGTTVSNTATVGYAVGGVNQTAVNSNTAVFTVSKRINLTVAKVGSPTQVVPGSTSQVVAFTVTNTTNAVQDFRLVATQEAAGTTTGYSHTATFTSNNLRTFVDAGTTGVFNAAADTGVFIDQLAPDTSKTVFILVDVPATAVNGGIDGVTLTAVAAGAGTPGTLGADVAQTSGAGNLGGVDTVFADAAGPVSGDALHDGKASDHGEYDVVTATLALVKSAKTISDPINGTTNPKAIPGATMEYCIQVQNTGAAAASSINVSDTVPTNTTYLANTLYAGGTVTGGVCNSDGTSVTDATGFNAGVVTLAVPTVAAGATSTARFRVTIN